MGSDLCPFCGSERIAMTRKADRVTNEGWHCGDCATSWSGPRSQSRSELASPITHAAMFAVFTKMVKRLRTLQREENVRFGYPLASITGMRLEGRIEGYTRVLEMVCNDPLED